MHLTVQTESLFDADLIIVLAMGWSSVHLEQNCTMGENLHHYQPSACTGCDMKSRKELCLFSPKRSFVLTAFKLFASQSVGMSMVTQHKG